MGNKSQSTYAKRQKELARQARQKDKHARRLEARQKQAEGGVEPAVTDEHEDPDLAGIALGPQPIADDDEAGDLRHRDFDTGNKAS